MDESNKTKLGVLVALLAVVYAGYLATVKVENELKMTDAYERQAVAQEWIAHILTQQTSVKTRQ